MNDIQPQYTGCPVCGFKTKPWRSKKSQGVIYKIEKCTGCGYAFVNPRPTEDEICCYYKSERHGNGTIVNLSSVLEREKTYPNSTVDAKRIFNTIQKIMDSDYYKQELNLLDIGCGYGVFSKEAIDRGFNVSLIEMADTERTIAKQLTGVEPVSVPFEQYKCKAESFDAILMSQILEHAIDINLWIDKACKLLKKGGILAIALPNFNGIYRYILQENDPFICPPAHLNYFSPNSLAKLLQKYGFRVQETQWISRIPLDALDRRLPRFLKQFLLPIANKSVRISLSAMDACHLGVIINMYALK